MKKELEVLKGFIGKSQLPILETIYLKDNGEGLTMVATDLESYARAEVEGSYGLDCCVDGRLFSSLMNSFKSPQIVQNEIVMNVSENGNKYELPIISTEEYPIIGVDDDDKEIAVVNAEDFVEALSKTVICVGQSWGANLLENVYFRFEGERIVVVGCDGTRIAKVVVGCLEQFSDEKKAWIISASGVKKLVQALKEKILIKIKITSSLMKVFAGNIEIGIRLVYGEYPDFEKIVHEVQGDSYSCDREKILEALNRLAYIQGKDDIAIKIKSEGNVTKIKRSVQDVGVGDESFASEGKIDIILDLRKLRDGICVRKDKHLQIRYMDAQHLIALENENGWYYVLMPIKDKN